MAVTREDVRHVAALARIGVPDDRVDGLVAEINGILAHMDVLAKVDTSSVTAAAAAAAAAAASDRSVGMPLAPDEPPPVALARPREDFAPETRDGFFLVPRLATHDDAGSSA